MKELSSKVSQMLVCECRNFDEKPSHWSGVFAMALCIFTLVASEFMPVSLLTPIAHSLNVTEGMAGQGIAISGAFAVFTSLFITTITNGLNRKSLLLILTILMGVSGAVIGFANSYYTYMIGRALIGAVVGGFWSMSAAIAMRLVPKESVSRALVIFNSGNAFAIVIAAPLGAYLGTLIGWRGAFLCLIPVSFIALLWQYISLPSMPVKKQSKSMHNALATFTLLRRPIVLLGMLSVGVFFMGQFSLYTYIRPFLETVTLVDATTLSLILMLIGASGFAGTMLINIPLKKAFYPTLIVIPTIMAATACGLVFVEYSVTGVTILLGIWGLVSTAAPVGWWAWIPKTFPEDAEKGGGLLVAVIQLSIALGSTVGGILFDSGGLEITFLVSALLLIISAVFTLRTAQLTPSPMK